MRLFKIQIRSLTFPGVLFNRNWDNKATERYSDLHQEACIAAMSGWFSGSVDQKRIGKNYALAEDILVLKA
jgi:hypothetical protein